MPYPCVCRMTLCFILILVLKDDDNDDGLLTTGGEAAKERREYGTISWAVYWQYLKVGDSHIVHRTKYIAMIGRGTVPSWGIPLIECSSAEYEGKNSVN